jgi:hypothetical protein
MPGEWLKQWHHACGGKWVKRGRLTLPVLGVQQQAQILDVVAAAHGGGGLLDLGAVDPAVAVGDFLEAGEGWGKSERGASASELGKTWRSRTLAWPEAKSERGASASELG